MQNWCPASILSTMQRKTFNAKRRLQSTPLEGDQLRWLEDLSTQLRYVGSPLHKKGPGDFKLDPPAALRPGKSICDDVIDCRADAQRLLRDGAKRGLISVQINGDYPQNVWAVTPEGVALEAMLDNSEWGSYHGYPMPEADPLRMLVLDRWRVAHRKK